jgi:hypothetical protein
VSFTTTEAQALRAANAAAKRLPGWRVRVWENLGWHWSLVDRSGCVKLHPLSEEAGGGWTAFVGSDSSTGGFWAEHGRTPREAIERTVAAGNARVAPELIALTRGEAALRSLPVRIKRARTPRPLRAYRGAT